MVEKSAVIRAVCDALANGAKEDAISLLGDYPFASELPTVRRYGAEKATRVFVRDGFIDQYTGKRLVFVPALRLLSIVLPKEFPYHLNWRAAVTHPAYWELGATIDHVKPVTHRGDNDESNLVTTSMARNSAKMNYTLQELGWTFHDPGNEEFALLEESWRARRRAGLTQTQVTSRMDTKTRLGEAIGLLAAGQRLGPKWEGAAHDRKIQR